MKYNQFSHGIAKLDLRPSAKFTEEYFGFKYIVPLGTVRAVRAQRLVRRNIRTQAD